MTIQQPLCYRALDISCFAPPSQCCEDESIITFRRTSSAPGLLPTSTIEMHPSWERAHYSSADQDATSAESKLTYFTISEVRGIRGLHENRKIKEENYEITLTRSRSCGFEPSYVGREGISSFVRRIKNQDAVMSSNYNSHGEFPKHVCGCACISSNCCLNDASSPNDCFSYLTAHDAATIGVDIPSHRPMDSLDLVTWNLASPNNPFEFWVRS
jgi:hypothetical protein